MLHRSLRIALLSPLLLLAACQGSMHDSPAAPSAAAARDHGYALLYSTIKDECDVDKVLILKSPAAPVADLIKSIGQFSRAARDTLQTLAKEDPAVALDAQGLPEAESKTRDAISSSTSKQILFSGGKELEFRLLLTQHEALNYITHLAGVVGDQEPRDNRKRYLAQLTKESAALHERVLVMLKTPYVDRAK